MWIFDLEILVKIVELEACADGRLSLLPLFGLFRLVNRFISPVKPFVNPTAKPPAAELENKRL